MSRRLSGSQAEHYRTTDHSDEIEAMQKKSMEIVHKYPTDGLRRPSTEEFKDATILMAAAALLQGHDDTGISLDNWTGPRELVITGLDLAGFDSEEVFLENGI